VRQQDREAALGAGFDEHLAKPVDATRLVGTITRLVGERAIPLPAA
jgi:CheY-like chemotaxis protein